MEQLELSGVPRMETADPWLRNPLIAFENWQRSVAHSAGFTYSERSVRQHCAMWHRFSEFLQSNKLDLCAIQADRLALFLESLRGKDGKPAEESTKRRYLRLLAATFEHLKSIGLRHGGNPCAVLGKYFRPAPEKNPGGLAAQDDDRFVDMVLAEKPRFWRDYRDQAMLTLIIGSGLYTSEVIALEMHQIVLDAEPPYIDIPAHGKVPERKAPIIAFAREPLRKWLEIRATLPLDGESTVFVSGKGGRMLPATLYRKVQAILKANGADLRPRGGFGPQVLRNAFLVRQLAKEKPIDVVQQWAGHVEVKSTQRFQRLVVNPRGIEAE